MSSFDQVNGAAVLLALVSAIGMPGDQRRAAGALAALFALNWWHFIQSYSPRPLAAALWDIGLPLASNDLWALLDAVTAMVALVIAAMKRAWWGAAIFILSTSQVFCHGLYWDVGLLPRGIYYPALDKLFLAQVAVFIFAGGGGIVSRARRFLDSGRHVRRTGSSALFRAH